MRLDKIKIENFKSIDKLEFSIQKNGSSYTTMLLGINEAGKSNILQAMSFLDTPEEELDYFSYHNQKNEKNDDIDILFYFSFEYDNTYIKLIRPLIENVDILDFKLTHIHKNSYFRKDTERFRSYISFEADFTKGLFIKKITSSKHSFEVRNKNDENGTFVELTNDVFNEFFKEKISEIIETYMPRVSFWKPSDEYLIPSSVDLSIFRGDVETNIPLKNIFMLSGYKTQVDISEIIEGLQNNQARRKLMSKLSADTTKYIKSIWKHKIAIDIEISEGGICTISIKDDGVQNEYNFYEMSARSEGFKQFVSLILSLSVESEKQSINNWLILIDEPETHLHPSGIRDLGKELLKIGKNNYLFVATHSPFIIDRECMERNIIIKKNLSAQTIKKEITKKSDLRDDEVLTEAFGINPYRDLLNPHRILVEGLSDKLILKKALDIQGLEYGITNGMGSNIVSNASKYNHDDIKILIIVDDDDEGRKYQDDILKIGGVFDKGNVHTIRDIVGSMSNKGTIEDLLSKNFIESKYKEFYKSEFDEEPSLEVKETPFIEQIKKHLQKEKKLTNKELKTKLDKFKKKISEDFKPAKTSFKKNFPLLHEFVDKIQKLQES